MGRNEKTSHRIAKIASKALKGIRITKKELKSLAATALTQTADKRKH